MTGFLVINHFLKGEKFDTLHRHLKDRAKHCGIRLLVRTNLEMQFETEKADFVLFWDKDVRLAAWLEVQGFPVFNSSASIALCDDKAKTYLALQNTVPQPKTLLSPLTFFPDCDFTPFIRQAAGDLGLPLVFKECCGSFGEQVFLCHTLADIADHIQKAGSRPFLLQAFVAESAGHDVRLEIVNGRCVAAMRRENKMDFRANVTAGGTMAPYAPTNAEIATAVQAANKLGLLFGGIDLLDGGLLCEVNSNAHIINIMQCTGTDIAPYIFNAIREKLS